jgi:uncharacterized membrane protein
VTAAAIIDAAQIYVLIGALFAAVFLTIGIDRIDEDARGAYAFRPLLIPAVLLIWPLVAWRWLREETGAARWQGRHSPPRAAHGVAAVLMALLVFATLIAGVVVRQTWPEDIAPVQLSAPEVSQ